MAKFLVQKSGPLQGEVTISGAKNAVLPIMAATLLTEEKCVIKDVPALRDVDVMCQLLESMGASVDKKLDQNTVEIEAGGQISYEAPFDLVKMMRASILVLGALLLRTGRAVIHLPGGCAIGKRPVELHLKGLKALGVKINEEQLNRGIVDASAEKMTGSTIYLDFPSVGATEVIMMAAALAEGRTTIENAAKEPHVVDLANFLNSMGANIKGAGTDVIRIRGVERLHKTEYPIIPDQIEAGTFMFAAAATHGDVTVKNVIPKHLESISAKLSEIGCEVTESDDAVRVVASRPLKHTQVKTLPYPGFPTDMQPQIAVTLGLCCGTSIVTESIFENRFRYVDELIRMGASIKVEGNTAIIDGVSRYTGASINAPDLRAGAALVIAALAAEGMSVIDDIRYIERGYEDFPAKLQSLGAQIEKVESERELQKFRLKIG